MDIHDRHECYGAAELVLQSVQQIRLVVDFE